jgi:hypothetical protein
MGTDYVRTEEELEKQRVYEMREASHHVHATQIRYRIIEGVPSNQVVTKKIGWRVGRRVGEEKEFITDWFYRRVEMTEHIRLEIQRDNLAAQRLGVGVCVATI